MPSEAMPVSMDAPRPWRVLGFRGELDIAQAGAVRKSIDEALIAAERPYLALDLGDVSFCDSYGLSVLVYAAKKVRERDGALRVTSVSRQVRMIIERCGLERLLVLPAPAAQNGAMRQDIVR